LPSSSPNSGADTHGPVDPVGVTTPAHARMADGRDAPHATFVRPDLGSFCRLDELGLQVVGQRIEPGRSVLARRVVETDEFARWCRRCGCEAAPRDSVTRRLAHEPLGWRPTTLLITIRRYRYRLWACVAPGHQPGRRAAREVVASRAAMGARRHRVSALDRRSGRRGPQRVVEHRERRGAGRGQACVDRGPTPVRRCGSSIGLDEHCWRHTRRGDNYVTVIIDLTPIRDGTGPARLLDMVEGRSKQVFKTWLGERDTSWRDGVEVVAMGGLTGSRPPPSKSCPTRWL